MKLSEEHHAVEMLGGLSLSVLACLPLPSDVELDGSQRSKAIGAAGVLFGFVVLYAILSLAGGWLANPWMVGLSSQILLYAFVLSFLLPPLDGGDVWANSRRAWLALFLLLLVASLGYLIDSEDQKFFLLQILDEDSYLHTFLQNVLLLAFIQVFTEALSWMLIIFVSEDSDL